MTHHITPGPAAAQPPDRHGAYHYQPPSVLGTPVLTDHPDNNPRPAVHLQYDDGSWDWATQADLAREHAATWTQVAERLDAMNARKAAAA